MESLNTDLANKAVTSQGGSSTKGGQNKSMTIQQRRFIQEGITANHTKVSIAQSIQKEKSTIGKEIKLHRYLKNPATIPLSCQYYEICADKNCSLDCRHYKAFHCTRRDRSPGACNGCEKYDTCPHDRYWYDAEVAQNSYESLLVKSRQGFNVTKEEADHIWSVIEPHLREHMSVAEIIDRHPELGICSKTLYNYLNKGLFPVDRKGREWVPLTAEDSDAEGQTKELRPHAPENLYKKRKRSTP